VIVANGQAAVAARTAAPEVALVFVTSDDPVKRGLVGSFARPGGLATGVTFFGGGQIGAKRVELLAEAAPRVESIGFLRDPSWAGGSTELADAAVAASRSGRRLVPATADHVDELRSAFATLVAQGARAVVVGGSPKFTSARRALVDLAALHRLPGIYDQRAFPEIGGLMSYGGSLVGAYRQAGEYAARIVRGTRPGDLPVLQPTAFELVLNTATARDLRLELPRALVLRADDLIA
jgi:putative ABC transport system substrate-binding protein